jgi:alkanesulfonate monooxygenase SsuD/methylene tetrahydromethanopterin reductase-like flavin-dependent oxidoreductase (luciferase family)
VAAEEAGLHGAWVAEHHFIRYGVVPSAVTFAAMALGRTTRIEVGTAVSVLSAQHPVALAEQATLLDHLSGGRFRLGVGRGGPWLELEVMGTGLARWERGFPEALDLLLACLDGKRGRVGAAGEFFRFREVTLVPRPKAAGSPPVIVACTSEASVELAAARGLPVLLGMHIGDEEKACLLARWGEVAARHGHDTEGVEHAAAGVAHIADTRARAVTELRGAMPAWLEHGLADYTTVDGRERSRRDPHAYTDFLCSIHPVGTPDDCVERLEATARRTGIRRFLLLVEGTGDPPRTMETIARLGAEVLPRLSAVG